MNNTASSKPATVDETLAVIRKFTSSLGAEQIHLTKANGRVLCETVCAPEDQPPFDRSAVDGFAIRLDDSSKHFRIIDRIRAGDWKPRKLQLGEAVQIATGGALPGAGLQVVMKEDVRVTDDRVEVIERDKDLHIRFRGEDAYAGAPLVSTRTRLGPGALALLASIGGTKPLVSCLPRVMHLATGNEIVPPEQQPDKGQIRDSNSTLVRAFMEQHGIIPEQFRVAEDRAAIDSALRTPQCPPHPDLLLISGGASVGEHDFTRSLLEELGYTIRISRTTTRPGKPLIFATRGDVVAFGLPGNPLAHFVCLHLYVDAALNCFSGAKVKFEFAEGVLAEEFIPDSNARETLWPARVGIDGSNFQLTPLPWRSSGDLTSLATANALVRIPPVSGKLAPGAKLQFKPTAPWL